ncbi:MAG TPA: GNAT family N-acetyltransferase [Puia sp.]|jgi:ribosomal-protein-alanine N-acetyltransferase|nr:GNAT family N-acetyltransferase [Puia sp.]
MDFPVLTSKRLTLRQLDDNDYNEIFALRSDDNLNKYIARRKATNIEEAKEFIKKINAGVNGNKSLYWAICFSDSKKLIGTICLWNLSEDKTVAEVGYELNPTYQKMGIMNEALQCVINYGFNEIGLTTIEAYTHKDNSSSSRLLKKNNFKIDDLKKDEEGINNVIYSLKKNQ